MKLLDLFVGTPFSEALGWTLLHSLWEGLIVAAALAVFLSVVRSPRTRYAAAGVALLAMLASLAITFIQFLPGGENSARTLIKTTHQAWKELPAMTGTNSQVSNFVTLIPCLAPLWLVGVCLFYSRYAAAWLYLHRLQRRGICAAPDSWQRAVKRLALELQVKRPVVLLESLLADTPMVLWVLSSSGDGAARFPVRLAAGLRRGNRPPRAGAHLSIRLPRERLSAPH